MFRLLPLILFSLVVSSCALESPPSASLDNSEENQELYPESEGSSDEGLGAVSEKENEDLEHKELKVTREEVTAIEIEWRAPKTKVMRYIIRYGQSPDNLDSEEEINLEDVKIENHPVHGALYKYLLIGLPAKATIYYTLQAENEFGLSEPTPVAKEEVKGP